MRFAVVYLLLIIPKLLLAEASKEEIPTVSELTEGILAFNCYEKADDFFPVILTEDTNGWAAIGIPDLDIIREVDNGFAFKSSKNDLLLAFLKEEGDNWQLEYFDEDGLNAAKCLEADEFAETIIEVIAPKIFDNANSLSSQLKLTQQELADEVIRGKEREGEFRDLLTAKTNQYERELSNKIAQAQRIVADEVAASLIALDVQRSQLEAESKKDQQKLKEVIAIREKTNTELRAQSVLDKIQTKKQIEELSDLLTAETLRYEAIKTLNDSLKVKYDTLVSSLSGGAAEYAGRLIEQIIAAEPKVRTKLILQSKFSDAGQGGNVGFCWGKLSYKPQELSDGCKNILIKYWVEN